MPEAPAGAVLGVPVQAPVTFLSEKPFLSVSVKLDDGSIDTIFFAGGKFVSSDPAEIAAVKGSSLFKSGRIVIAPSPRESLLMALADAQAHADKANQVLSAARKALADFEAAQAAAVAVAPAAVVPAA